MMKHIMDAIDWTSIKLNGFTLIGIFSGDSVLQLFSCIGIATTIFYNAVRIYKEFKNKKQ